MNLQAQKAPLLEASNDNVVLVVDDSPMQRKILSAALKKWGYEVVEAASGLTGLEVCKSRDIHMVISDWMMPGMDGPTFCEEFRKMDRNAYGYFILLTSKGDADEIALGLNSGADDFLTKPVSFGELQARMRAGTRIVEMQMQLVEKNRLVNQTLGRMQALYDGLNRDLAKARNLQQTLVRDTHVRFGGSDAAFVLQPSGHVGGDLVGHFAPNDREVGLFSLDVSGHGVAAALMTARLAGYLSGLTPKQNVALKKQPDGTYTARDPAMTADILNGLLLRELETEHYFTMAMVIVDLQTGHLRGVQAGHPHPVIRRACGRVDVLGDGGLPIGLLSSANYHSFETMLCDGDRLLLHSDGVTECASATGELWDEDRLHAELSAHPVRKGEAWLDGLISQLREYAGSEDFEDDVSALVFDYAAPQKD